MHLQNTLSIKITKILSKYTEFGHIKTLLPLLEMAISFGLKEEHPKRLRVKRGRKSFLTPEGKMALAFLKSYKGLSVPKLMDALNANSPLSDFRRYQNQT